jgi:cobalt-zinc-cadmium resistance protein CzcA
MLFQLVSKALDNRLLLAVGVLLLAGLGAYALLTLPIDAFPDTTPVQVQVNTVASSLAPEEIEQLITLPIELSLGGLPGLTEVRSVSKFGFSQVVATFTDDTSIIDARQHVAERVGQVSLPDGIASPQLGPIATGLGEVFHYVVRSTDPERSLEDLRTIHDWIIKPELRKVPGVAEVNSWGGKVRQFHVVLSPEGLARYDLTVADIAGALQANNRATGGGLVTSGGESRVVHGAGRVGSLQDIGAIVVTSFGGRPVLIADVAESLEIGHEIRRGAVTAQGRGEAVLGLAFTLMGENPAAVTEALKAQLAGVLPSLPEDVEVEVVYDRTELTANVIHTVRENLIAGAILVVVVLYLLLGNLRAGLIVAFTIPLALLCAAMGMHAMAIAASLLSFGAIDFGILVDGSVVMAESSQRRLEERRRELGRKLTARERREAVREASRPVVRPIVFGMGIILLVFIPILTLEGTEGKMFQPMALTFMFALAGALALALLVTPALSAWLLPETPSQVSERVAGRLVGAYQRLLARVLRRRGTIIAAAIVVVLVGGLQAMRTGGVFLPRLREGAIVVNTIRLAGVAIDESARLNTRIEQRLLEEFPDEIRFVWSRIGTAEVATDPMGPELTDIFMSLHPRDRWTRASNQAELATAIERVVSEFPGANFAFSQPIEMRLNEMASGIRADLGVMIFGDDFEELTRVGEEIQTVLSQIPGAGDVSMDQVIGQPELSVRVDREALARNGMPATDVLQVVEALGGLHVGDVFEDQRPFPLVVRWPDRYREDPDALADMIVTGSTGALAPLSQIADVREVDGLGSINREWGRRLIRVQANVPDRDVLSFVAEAKERIASTVDLPTGYVVEWGGQFQNLERARLRLGIAVPTALVLVLLLLYLSLRRLRDVVLIATAIPFAFVGGVAALAIAGLPFSVSAAVGFIALAGIAVLNGQILVSAVRDQLELGLERTSAIIEAGGRRLRPVLATAITDAAGFIPMAVSLGVGAEVQRPLATVVIGGVISSTVLTLFVLPVLISFFAGDDRADPLVNGTQDVERHVSDSPAR